MRSLLGAEAKAEKLRRQLINELQENNQKLIKALEQIDRPNTEVVAAREGAKHWQSEAAIASINQIVSVEAVQTLATGGPAAKAATVLSIAAQGAALIPGKGTAIAIGLTFMSSLITVFSTKADTNVIPSPPTLADIREEMLSAMHEYRAIMVFEQVEYTVRELIYEVMHRIDENFVRRDATAEELFANFGSPLRSAVPVPIMYRIQTAICDPQSQAMQNMITGSQIIQQRVVRLPTNFRNYRNRIHPLAGSERDIANIARENGREIDRFRTGNDGTERILEYANAWRHGYFAYSMMLAMAQQVYVDYADVQIQGRPLIQAFNDYSNLFLSERFGCRIKRMDSFHDDVLAKYVIDHPESMDGLHNRFIPWSPDIVQHRATVQTLDAMFAASVRTYNNFNACIFDGGVSIGSPVSRSCMNLHRFQEGFMDGVNHALTKFEPRCPTPGDVMASGGIDVWDGGPCDMGEGCGRHFPCRAKTCDQVRPEACSGRRVCPSVGDLWATPDRFRVWDAGPDGPCDMGDGCGAEFPCRAKFCVHGDPEMCQGRGEDGIRMLVGRLQFSPSDHPTQQQWSTWPEELGGEDVGTQIGHRVAAPGAQINAAPWVFHRYCSSSHGAPPRCDQVGALIGNLVQLRPAPWLYVDVSPM